jgi:hypothetical protein
MKWTLPIIAIGFISLSCGEQKPKVETNYDFYDDVTDTRPEDSDGKDKKKDKGKEEKKKEPQGGDSGVEQPLLDPILADETIELEELEMEDNDALTALISARLSSSSQKKKNPPHQAM